MCLIVYKLSVETLTVRGIGDVIQDAEHMITIIYSKLGHDNLILQ